MSVFSRVLPAMVLASSLAPFAASAHGDAQAAPAPAHEYVLSGGFNQDQPARAAGRVAAVNAEGSQHVIDAAALFAAIQSLPVEN